MIVEKILLSQLGNNPDTGLRAATRPVDAARFGKTLGKLGSAAGVARLQSAGDRRDDSLRRCPVQYEGRRSLAEQLEHLQDDSTVQVAGVSSAAADGQASQRGDSPVSGSSVAADAAGGGNSTSAEQPTGAGSAEASGKVIAAGGSEGSLVAEVVKDGKAESTAARAAEAGKAAQVAQQAGESAAQGSAAAAGEPGDGQPPGQGDPAKGDLPKPGAAGVGGVQGSSNLVATKEDKSSKAMPVDHEGGSPKGGADRSGRPVGTVRAVQAGRAAQLARPAETERSTQSTVAGRVESGVLPQEQQGKGDEALVKSGRSAEAGGGKATASSSADVHAHVHRSQAGGGATVGDNIAASARAFVVETEAGKDPSNSSADAQFGNDRGAAQSAGLVQSGAGGGEGLQESLESETLRVNQQRLAERIVRSVQVGNSYNNAVMRIRLEPPQLGSVRVNLRLKGGVLSVTLTAGSESARQILHHSLAHLRASLEAAGVQLSQLSVQLQPQQHGGAESSNPYDNPFARQGQQGGADHSGPGARDGNGRNAEQHSQSLPASEEMRADVVDVEKATASVDVKA